MLMTTFEQTLEIAETLSTRTKVTVQAKKDARKAVESKTRIVLKAYVTYNFAVTNSDRDAMGLPVHKTSRTSMQYCRIIVVISGVFAMTNTLWTTINRYCEFEAIQRLTDIQYCFRFCALPFAIRSNHFL
jgi:hypothetical protein